MKLNYQLQHQDKNSKARYGLLTVSGGHYETPMFMPVATLGTVKTLSFEEVKACGSAIVLCNTYHLWLRPGEGIIEKAGGLHKFINYDLPILTDSGGFQVFSLASSRKITDEGVYFRNHLNGDLLFLSPEKSITIQNQLGANIIMSFDECPPYPVSYQYMKKSIKRTLDWAKRGKKAHLNKRQALFGIVQGGAYTELRKESALETVKLNFDGYAIGGVSVGEDKKTMYQMIDDSIPYLPEDKVRYLMGVGDPIDIIEAVARGIDLFDCVQPTRLGRHGNAFTKDGKINLRNSKFKDNFKALEDDCDCYTCTHYSASYLRHLILAKESLGSRLLSIHNLRFLIKLTEDIRYNIKNDTFLTFKEAFINRYNKACKRSDY